MKKLLSIILTSVILTITFVEAKDNGSIEQIGNDIVFSYNGENITIHKEKITYDTQKCPAGYHIGTAQDWSRTMELWYNITGKNYKNLKIHGEDLRSLSEGDDEGRSYYTPGLHNFLSDIGDTGGGGYPVVLIYKTESKDLKNYSLLLEYKYYRTSDSAGYRHTNSYVELKPCNDSDFNNRGCNKILNTRCFKDDKITNNGFTKEYNDAYIFAYNKRITTMPSIEKANMNGEIKRMEIAKMLSNWVKSFGFYQDPKASCNFTDTDSVKGDLATAIIESCRYGIMGQGITRFRPNDKITKAEVATAISRILRKSKYDGGNPYYINHINALKDVGVLTDTSNIKVNEIRGNVMVMLMKANNILENNLNN